MSATHLHLALCHVPVIGEFIALAGLAAGLLFKEESLKRWSLVLMFFSALSALPVFWTGNEAEERISGLSGVSADMIESHEEAAETTLAVTLVSGGAAAVSLLLAYRKMRLAQAAVFLSLAAGAASAVLLAYSANLGGRIRHTEIEEGRAPL